MENRLPPSSPHEGEEGGEKTDVGSFIMIGPFLILCLFDYRKIIADTNRHRLQKLHSRLRLAARTLQHR